MTLRSTVGRWTEKILKDSWSSTQCIDIVPATRLSSLLSSVFGTTDSNSSDTQEAGNGSALPPGFHFVYHNPNSVNLGRDGYDNYQAPVDLQSNAELFHRRMWVKGKVNFVKPIAFDSQVECIERIKGVRYLENTCFVTIERKFQSVIPPKQEDVLIEERTLAYSNKKYAATVSNKENTIECPEKRLSLSLSQLHNFRYSALTYNAHKIHYDLEYCIRDEGYSNVLISGPFSISVLLNWFSTRLYPELTIRSIDYKNRSPIYQNDLIELTCVERKQDQEYSLQILNAEKVVLVDAIVKTGKD